jgi:hypothetical protein
MQIYHVIFIIIGVVLGITIISRCYICCFLKNKNVDPS